jgi:hypothetical protein
MAGEDRVRPDSCRGAGTVYVREHQRAAAVLRASGERWMMDRDDDCSGELIALHPVECGCQKRNLAAIKRGVLAILARDDAGVLQHIAVKAEDANEKRLQREVHPGWIIVARSKPPASGDCDAVAAQKLRRKASSVGTRSWGYTTPS